MVKSTIVGITPASHADLHRTGGSDPLTGAVGINAIDPPAIHASRHDIGGADEVIEYELSADVILDSSVQKSTNQAAYTKTKEITYAGTAITVRTVYSYYKRQTAVTGYRLYINGVAQGTERLPGSGSNTWYQSQEDFPVVDGDLIQVYSKTNFGGSEVTGVKDFKILGIIKRKAITVAANDP